jgi:thiamine pyrophosphokinase
MRVIIIAGGQADPDTNWQRWVRPGDLVLGADGGASQALAWGLVPHVVVGDMDSLPEPERADLEARGCRFVIHPRAKDETDLELALGYAAGQGALDIVILGALGGRLDHTLANILLLALPVLSGLQVRIAAGQQEARLLRGGELLTVEGSAGDLVSLLPLGGDAQGVTTHGLAWVLQNDILRFGSSRGVSNEMVGHTARIKLEKGYVLVVHAPPPSD